MTNPVDYSEDNIPANLKVVTPRATFTRVPPTADNTCSTSSGVQQSMRFEVEVQDANVSDELVGRLLVNGQLNPSNYVQPVTVTGEMYRGVITICVRMDLLNRACNHVEYLVSREFVDFPDYYTTRDRADYAEVDWWVLGSTNSYPNALPSDCEELLRDGGVP